MNVDGWIDRWVDDLYWSPKVKVNMMHSFKKISRCSAVRKVFYFAPLCRTQQHCFSKLSLWEIEMLNIQQTPEDPSYTEKWKKGKSRILVEFFSLVCSSIYWKYSTSMYFRSKWLSLPRAACVRRKCIIRVFFLCYLTALWRQQQRRSASSHQSRCWSERAPSTLDWSQPPAAWCIAPRRPLTAKGHL